MFNAKGKTTNNTALANIKLFENLRRKHGCQSASFAVFTVCANAMANDAIPKSSMAYAIGKTCSNAVFLSVTIPTHTNEAYYLSMHK